MELSGEKSRSELRDIWSSGPSNGFGGHQQPKALKSQTTDLTMQSEAKLTLDGLMTLVAGIIAFVAVIIQIRSSSHQVRDQIRAQRDAEQAERERQKKAIATALLFEIDDFYRYHVRGAYDRLDGKARSRELPEVVRIPQSRFAVYEGNTPRLGELPHDLVEAVVHFYSKAEHLFAMREDYRAERERGPANILLPQGTKAFTLMGHIRDFLPGLTLAAYIACEGLSGFADVKFEPLRIAIAGEDVAALNRNTERIEHEEVHRL
jgi:uncharacterized protein YjeT (DUF2065 family)